MKNKSFYQDRYKFSPSADEKKIPVKQAMIAEVKNLQEKVEKFQISLISLC
jgi:hypothetical protein